MSNPYRRKIRGVAVDVYDVLVAFEVTNPARQHAIKKLLMAGRRRGDKTEFEDVQEARESLTRDLELQSGEL